MLFNAAQLWAFDPQRGTNLLTKHRSDQHFYKVPLKGLEPKSHSFNSADFAENPRKINDLGVNVIQRNRLVCPRMWANRGQKRDDLAVDLGRGTREAFGRRFSARSGPQVLRLDVATNRLAVIGDGPRPGSCDLLLATRESSVARLLEPLSQVTSEQHN
jgi:hypothetical protein